jgi:8-oxo-dGTP pyrophosphatase MutT (NUDIX family)
MKESIGNDSNKYGAGILIVCKSTKKILLGLRSGGDQSNTWCIFGGVLKNQELPLNGAIRETFEESELIPDEIMSKPIHTNLTDDGFKYYTFLGFFDTEREPRINNEHLSSGWFGFDELDGLNLHTEFKKSLHPKNIELINSLL